MLEKIDCHADWEFYFDRDSQWYSADVPGVVHLDLLEHELIDDPYWEDNEVHQRWIEENNWAYRTVLEIDERLLARDRISLNFKGLDTYAQVFLNDSLILDASNMFRHWEVDIKELLQAGANELRIEFESPINKNKNRVAAYSRQLPSGNEGEDIPVKVSPFVRKAAYQFGWDWGPRFVTSGIWRPVQLIVWDGARIQNAYTRTLDIDEGIAAMETEIELEVEQAGTYILKLDDQSLEVDLEIGWQIIRHGFKVEDPQLWWTHDLGEPHLYDQDIQLFNKNTLIDSFSVNYGIRTINLVNESDNIGTSFYFELNGKPVFMKGANYIPQDLFLPRVDSAQYVDLITAAQEAHMNMIRVWGGAGYDVRRKPLSQRLPFP
jgi:beta-mannosidase